MLRKEKGYIIIEQEYYVFVNEGVNGIEFHVIVSKNYRIVYTEKGNSDCMHRKISEKKTIDEIIRFLEKYDYRVIIKAIHMYIRKLSGK